MAELSKLQLPTLSTSSLYRKHVQKLRKHLLSSTQVRGTGRQASGEERAGGAWQLTLQLDHKAKMLADQARRIHTHTHTHTHARTRTSV